ncbi:short-chain dehydrogenase [Chytridium lagenaria]|nr:short-chain dehydrogenase [Chytridium lagenaria]
MNRNHGPGDARPTALQIIKDQDLEGKLVGKVFLITGCSSGIGVETARAIHATGADVYITVRDVVKGGSGKIEIVKIELDSFASIREGAADFLKRSSKLNVLINNAGVMACPEGKTQDGFETQFGTNHLGHFLLFQLLKDTLLASSTPAFHSRVVSLSSVGHRMNKTANIYFANEIERRYASQGLHGLPVHPGGIQTELSRHPDTRSRFARFFKSPQQGAATTVWAAVAKEWEGKGGRYLEDVSEGIPVVAGGHMFAAGYAEHAYDAEAEGKLWSESLKMVGLNA